ncbi:MAG TPA: universal stress protein [Vicinamibacteria bacterium]|nr:universal stress protein [Vicinamibacteria bacterium]
MEIRKILVPTDFSESANHALKQAVELAARCRAKLHLFHVVEPFTDPKGGLGASVRDYLERLERDANEALSIEINALKGRGIDVVYTTERRISSFEGILAKVEELSPDLVVLGTRGRTGLKRFVMGSVAEKVLQYVPVNVLTIGTRSPVVPAGECFERILVPVDFSEPSKRAVSAARSLLNKGGQLFVGHVVASPIHPSFYAGGITRLFQLDPDLPERIRKNLSSWLEGEAAEILVQEGDVPKEILDMSASKRCQLIVMGNRGLSALEHFLLGSVSERVVRHSKSPVLTVH